MRRERSKLLAILFFLFLFIPKSGICDVWIEPYDDYEFACGVSGGKLILSANSDPKSFNPIVAKETSTTQITSFLFEGLTKVDPRTLEVVPNLAGKWETKDGIEWIFYLRDDVYWSDGEKFTADDVIFTFNELIYNPEIPSSVRDILTIEGEQITVEKIDKYRVKFILPGVFAPFLRAIGTEILPRHKYEPLVREHKFNFSMGLGSKACDIVGTGAYRLKSYLPSERVILERNPYYWKKDACANQLPYLEEIIFIIIANAETELLKFLEGEIDYYSLRPEDLAVLGPRQESGEFKIYNVGIASGSNFLVLNQNISLNPQTNKPFVKKYKLDWFRKESFRKAISFAINRRKIISIVYNELGVPQYSCLAPSNTLFYTEAIEKYPYNPPKANILLKTLEFKDEDGDGILEDSKGNKVEINFFTNANNSLRIKMAALIKKDLEAIGLKINFLPLDFNNLVVKLTATYDWEMIMIGFTGSIEPYFGKNVWSYKGTLHAWNPTGKPIDEYEKEIEDIFNKAARTLDVEERRRLYGRWQYIVSAKLPFIYTVLPYSLFAVSDRLGNVYPTVYGGAFPETERIYIKKGRK